MKFQSICMGVILAAQPMMSIAGGNESLESFSKAKRLLMKHVYNKPSVRFTVYCNAPFDAKKRIALPSGFVTTKHKKRAKRVEFEHIVPAENFGRNFSQWREGDSACINKKGNKFKGRKCAEKTNPRYRLMQSDMYNLYAAIGAVNASRSNYNFTMLPSEVSDFGRCDMRIENKKVQPPQASRGAIARTYLYMEDAYPEYRMSKSQRQLMNAWDKQQAVTKEECRKAYIIERIQGNENPILIDRCSKL